MTIKPLNYNLTFEPDLEKFTFKGWEILTFEVDKSIKEIILDAIDLRIVKCELFLAKKNNIKSFRVDTKQEKLVILLNEELKSEKFNLQIEFDGVLNDKLTGFYRSRYMVDGKEKVFATTQFEAADARRAFPCIDNPSNKATFDISLIIDKNLTVISNTLPVLRPHFPTAAVGKRLVRFEQTPLMSTYLLYLGVGELEWLEDKYKDVLIRVITTPGKKQFGKFAIECAKKSLEYFEKYFNFKYPLKKLDLIAVTEFASGAMENWGAITFRENALLFYPEKSSKATKQRIAEVIAHEIAHQWFGNLVTMKWWDDLWLNESFATYMAQKVLDRYWPKWDVWSQYVTDTVFEGMALDSLKSSHPIKVKVNNISEIDELFDEIAYEKGGSVLRMLDLYLGEDVFMKGLRKYIKEYQYKNAEAQNLWSILEKESSKKVLEIMHSYLLQTGFPKVTVNERQNVLSFEQSRFLYEEKDEKSIWKIPLVLKNGKDIIRPIYFPEKKLTIHLKPEEKFLTVNYKYAGFFITNYSEEILSNIGKNFKFVTDVDKVGFVHDYFALVKSGEKRLEDLYRYIDTFFREEESSLVLHYIIAKLTGIYLLLEDVQAKKLAVEFSKKAIRNLGYAPKKQENVVDAFLRTVALSSLTLFNDEETKKFINKQFINYMKDEKSLHSDLRGIVYSSANWFDERNYDVLKKTYEESLIQEEKAKLLSALGFSKNKDQIKEQLKYVMTPKVPLAFLPYGISSIARNPYARDIALDWLILIWPELVKRSAGLATMLLRRVLQAIIPIYGIGRVKEVENFFRKNKVNNLERSIEQVLEELRINSRFVKKYKKVYS